MVTNATRYSAEDVRRLYSDIRSKIQHEDGLVSNRLTWMITFQGLLFASYSFTLAPEATVVGAFSLSDVPLDRGLYSMEAGFSAAEFIYHIKWLRLTLALIGIAIALVALFGVAAAYRTIRIDNALFKYYRDRCEPGPVFSESMHGRFTNAIGVLGGILIPFMAAGAWIFLHGHDLVWLAARLLGGLGIGIPDLTFVYNYPVRVFAVFGVLLLVGISLWIAIVGRRAPRASQLKSDATRDGEPPTGIDYPAP